MSETLESIYSDGVLAKAKSLAANTMAVQRDAEDPSVWWVKGSGGTKYRVQVVIEMSETDLDVRVLTETQRDSQNNAPYRTTDQIREDLMSPPLLSCTCPNGRNRGGRPSCYHSAAVMLILESGEADSRPVMEDSNPLNEDFIGDDAKVEELRAQGYTETEIEFLRS